MSIAVGDKLPEITLMKMGDSGPEPVTLAELCAGKKAVIFAVPGAYTPTCSRQHLPGYIEHADALRARGVDLIACVSVNDPFVMDNWGRDAGAGDKVLMLADGNGDFATAIGLTMDAAKFGMGTRSQRYAMVVENGAVTALNVEQAGAFEASKAETILEML